MILRRTQIAGETVEYTSKTSYATAAEAQAFRDGIELANDSALSVVGICEGIGEFHVYIFDKDYDPGWE
jgi:hypothetical protein